MTFRSMRSRRLSISSGWRSKRRPDPVAATFFLERGLGRYLVADAIRARGYTVLPMAERFDLHLNRILQRAAKPGPYLYVIGAKGLEHRCHRGDRGLL